MSRLLLSFTLTMALGAWWVRSNLRESWGDDLVREARVTRVVDADTLDAEVKLRYSTTHAGRFRLLGFDAWEMTGAEKEKGKLAKARMEQLLGPAGIVYVRGGVEKDSFGRWLVSLRLPDGRDPVAVLREEGHGQ